LAREHQMLMYCPFPCDIGISQKSEKASLRYIVVIFADSRLICFLDQYWYRLIFVIADSITIWKRDWRYPQPCYCSWEGELTESRARRRTSVCWSSWHRWPFPPRLSRPFSFLHLARSLFRTPSSRYRAWTLCFADVARDEARTTGYHRIDTCREIYLSQFAPRLSFWKGTPIKQTKLRLPHQMEGSKIVIINYFVRLWYSTHRWEFTHKQKQKPSQQGSLHIFV
jgi:hypothetical protein